MSPVLYRLSYPDMLSDTGFFTIPITIPILSPKYNALRSSFECGFPEKYVWRGEELNLLFQVMSLAW
jgi:hypothetical protein